MRELVAELLAAYEAAGLTCGRGLLPPADEVTIRAVGEALSPGEGVPDVVVSTSTVAVDVDGDGVPDAVSVVEAIGVDVDGDGEISADELEVTETVAVRDDDGD